MQTSMWWLFPALMFPAISFLEHFLSFSACEPSPCYEIHTLFLKQMKDAMQFHSMSLCYSNNWSLTLSLTSIVTQDLTVARLFFPFWYWMAPTHQKGEEVWFCETRLTGLELFAYNSLYMQRRAKQCVSSAMRQLHTVLFC